MFQPDPNYALTQNFMMLRLLVAEKNVNTQTDRHARFMFYKYRNICGTSGAGGLTSLEEGRLCRSNDNIRLVRLTV